MSEVMEAVGIEAEDGGLVPISPEHLDVLIRSARFAQAVLGEADARDSLSSAAVRSLARGWGLGQQALFSPEFEEIVIGFDDGDNEDPAEATDDQAGRDAR